MSRATYLGIAQLHKLNTACISIREAFDGNLPYLVGSCLKRSDYRDVDVRLMLPDEEYDQLFPGAAGDDAYRNPWRLLACASVSTYLEQMTGLPIDFQFQRRTDANDEFDGYRHPLGMKRWFPPSST